MKQADPLQEESHGQMEVLLTLSSGETDGSVVTSKEPTSTLSQNLSPNTSSEPIDELASVSVSRDSLFSLYEAYLAEFHRKALTDPTNTPNIFKLVCWTSEHLSKFDSPPSSDGHRVDLFALFAVIKSYGGVSNVRSWTDVARKLGIHILKNNSFPMRLKKWVDTHHLGSFFDFLLGIPNEFHQSSPVPKESHSELNDNGDPISDSVALAAEPESTTAQPSVEPAVETADTNSNLNIATAEQETQQEVSGVLTPTAAPPIEDQMQESVLESNEAPNAISLEMQPAPPSPANPDVIDSAPMQTVQLPGDAPVITTLQPELVSALDSALSVFVNSFLPDGAITLNEAELYNRVTARDEKENLMANGEMAAQQVSVLGKRGAEDELSKTVEEESNRKKPCIESEMEVDPVEPALIVQPLPEENNNGLESAFASVVALNTIQNPETVHDNIIAPSTPVPKSQELTDTLDATSISGSQADFPTISQALHSAPIMHTAPDEDTTNFDEFDSETDSDSDSDIVEEMESRPSVIAALQQQQLQQRQLVAVSPPRALSSSSATVGRGSSSIAERKGLPLGAVIVGGKCVAALPAEDLAVISATDEILAKLENAEQTQSIPLQHEVTVVDVRQRYPSKMDTLKSLSADLAAVRDRLVSSMEHDSKVEDSSEEELAHPSRTGLFLSALRQKEVTRKAAEVNGEEPLLASSLFPIDEVDMLTGMTGDVNVEDIVTLVASGDPGLAMDVLGTAQSLSFGVTSQERTAEPKIMFSKIAMEIEHERKLQAELYSDVETMLGLLTKQKKMVEDLRARVVEPVGIVKTDQWREYMRRVASVWDRMPGMRAREVV